MSDSVGPPDQLGDSEERTVIEYRCYTPHQDRSNRPAETSLRDAYGLIRGHFKRRQSIYGRYQRWLGLARMGTTYDVYLTRVFTYSVIAMGIGALIGVVGVFALDALLDISIPMIPTGLAIGVGVALILGISIGGWMLINPWYVARQRGARIDAVLPHVVVFMQSASQIDPNPIKLIDNVADYKRIYGELAIEFDAVRKDVVLLNDDLLGALDNANSFIPSEALTEFFDDLSSLLESGGSVRGFLTHEVEQQLSRTEGELEELLLTLTTLAPIYVITVSVGPVVLLVALLVLGMIGANVIPYLFILTYVGLPLLVISSIVTLDLITSQYNLGVHTRRPSSDETADEMPEATEPWFERYRKRKHQDRLVARIRGPIETIRHKPINSLLVTAPLAIVVILAIIISGILPLSGDALSAEPIRYTTGYLVIPFLIMSIPLMTLHELKSRRDRAFEYRVPDALYSLAGANERGLPLDEGIELISRRFEGPIASEFEKTYRDIQLDQNVPKALENLANRHRLPRITMTVAVLRNIVKSSEDLAPSLRSLADDLDMRHSLERDRLQEMRAYAVVVSLGVLIYLLIILVLDAFLLPQIPDLGSQPVLGVSGQPAIETYQTVFFHSALILAAGSGLIMGKLTRDSLISGMKYVNALIAVVLIAFLVAGLY